MAVLRGVRLFFGLFFIILLSMLIIIILNKTSIKDTSNIIDNIPSIELKIIRKDKLIVESDINNTNVDLGLGSGSGSGTIIKTTDPDPKPVKLIPLVARELNNSIAKNQVSLNLDDASSTVNKIQQNIHQNIQSNIQPNIQSNIQPITTVGSIATTVEPVIINDELIYKQNNIEYYRQKTADIDNIYKYYYIDVNNSNHNKYFVTYAELTIPNKQMLKEEEVLIMKRYGERGLDNIIPKKQDKINIVQTYKSDLLNETISYASNVNAVETTDINQKYHALKQISLFQYANELYKTNTSLNNIQSMLLILKDKMNIDDIKKITNNYEIHAYDMMNTVTNVYVIYITPTDASLLVANNATIILQCMPEVAELKIDMNGINEKIYNSQGIIKNYLYLQINSFKNKELDMKKLIEATLNDTTKQIDIINNGTIIVNVEGYSWPSIMDLMDNLALLPHIYYLKLFIS